MGISQRKSTYFYSMISMNDKIGQQSLFDARDSFTCLSFSSDYLHMVTLSSTIVKFLNEKNVATIGWPRNQLTDLNSFGNVWKISK